MKKIITCASYGGSGSSAITDILKEFNNIFSAGDYEFTIAHEIDGISDLQYFLYDNPHRLNCDTAIFRFEELVKRREKDYKKYIRDFSLHSKAYIDSLSTLQWDGYWEGHQLRYSNFKRAVYYKIPYRIQLFINKFKKSNYEIVSSFKASKMTYSNLDNSFFMLTKEYTQSIIENVITNLPDDEIEYIALDQLVPTNNIERYLEYFNSIKVIVVDRDPRDLYLLNNLYWKEGWIPSHDVESFIKWYKLTRSYRTDNSNVLYIQFEDLVYNYERVLKEILDFLGIDKSYQIYKKQFFDPKVSKKNTKLYEQQHQFKEDIHKIFIELTDYCYI